MNNKNEEVTNMTDLEMYCNICENWISDYDITSMSRDEIHELIDKSSDVALWSEGSFSGISNYIFICTNCVRYGYHLKYGEPLKYRLKNRLRKLRLWYWRQRSRFRK